MGSTYRYILEEGSKKYKCPRCGQKRYVRYIDSETNMYLPYEYGRCDRENNCAYHLNPYQDGFNRQKTSKKRKGSKQPFSYHTVSDKDVVASIKSTVDYTVLANTRNNYESNNLVQWLLKQFDLVTVQSLIANYHIGTSNHWKGASIFWQIDFSGKIRGGKVMLYDAKTGRRVKEPTNHITWIHSVMGLSDFKLNQCLFGEHLLNQNPDKLVGVVESEKTCLIATTFFPDLIWLATGGLSQLSAEKCKNLKGRRVVLFPDLGAFDKWLEKAEMLEKKVPGLVIKVSRLLEDRAHSEEKSKGLDLADYLIRFDHRSFIGEDQDENEKILDDTNTEATESERSEIYEAENKHFPRPDPYQDHFDPLDEQPPMCYEELERLANLIIGPNSHLEHRELIAQLKHQVPTANPGSLLQLMISNKILCAARPYENLFMLVGSTPF